ncbi:MAG: ABC transporter substrate-binding protein [Bacillota bacterium]
MLTTVNRKLVLLIVFAFILSVAVSACAPEEETVDEPGEPGETREGGTLVIGRATEGDTLDPHRTLAAASSAVFTQILDTLIVVDTDMTFQPGLAEDWDISEDGLTYTFHLRDDVNFHDGPPVNAEAVKFTFDRIMDETEVAPCLDQLGPLVDVEVVDDYTISFTHSEPFAPFLYNLSVAYLGILSPTAVEEYGEDFGQNPVGSGPFMFEEWIPGERTVLVRNPDYVQRYPYADNPGPPYVEKLVFRTISEDQTLVASLETGEVHMGTPPLAEVSRLEDDPDFNMYYTEGGTQFYYLEFVWKKWPFDDIRVRQAVAHAIDRSEFITVAFEEMAKEIKSPMPPAIMGYSEEVGEQYGFDHDLEKAKSLLAQAGWEDVDGDGILDKDGEAFSVIYYTWDDPRQQRSAQLVQNHLSKVGIEVNIESMEIGTLFAKQPEQNHHMNIMGWSWGEPTILTMMWADYRNMGIYDVDVDNPPLAELLKKADTTPQPEERMKYIEEIQKITLEDALIIPICSPKNVVAVREEVKDFKFGPYGRWFYGDIWIDE